MKNSRFYQRCLKIVRELLQNPTAPLREGMVQSYLREFARRRPALKLCEDRAGNIAIQYASPKALRNAPLVIVAHMDHPGFWVEKVQGHIATLAFKGGVGKPHARINTRLKFFTTGRRQSIGSGRLLSARYLNGMLNSATARIIEGAARPGDTAMWDLPPARIEKGLIISRACDDLLGVAAALCALDQLARRRPTGIAVRALFTRSEELGFLGALEAIRLKTVPRNSAVLSLETSKALTHAPQGNGVILRVGDRASIFNPELTDIIWQSARQLAMKDRTFKCQRRLMDGGACEATAFCAAGYQASGLALPLGNYHNQAFGHRQRPQIGPETVSVSDFINAVRLLIKLSLRRENWSKPADRPAWLKPRMHVARQTLARP